MIGIPLSLTLLRLLVGPVAILAATSSWPRGLFGLILLLGFLSDYFDGVLARRLGVATPWLRRFDSNTDVVFYLCITASAFIVSQDTMKQGLPAVIVMILAEAVCLSVSFVKFRVFPATHCYTAKAYGLCLFLGCTAILWGNFGPWVLYTMMTVGLVADAEVVTILLLSKKAPVDVLSVCRLLRARAELQAESSSATKNGQSAG